MKKTIFYLLLILLSLGSYSQTQSFGGRVRIGVTPEETNLDSVLTIGSDRLVKHVRYTDLFTKIFGGITPFLDAKANLSGATFTGNISAPNYSGNWNGLASLDFMRTTGSVAETVSGNKTFSDDLQIGNNADKKVSIKRLNTGNFIELFRSNVNVANIGASSQGLRLESLIGGFITLNSNSDNVTTDIIADNGLAFRVTGIDGSIDLLRKTKLHTHVDLGNYMSMSGGSSTVMSRIGFNRDVSTGNIFNSTYGAYQLHNDIGKLTFASYNSSGGYMGKAVELDGLNSIFGGKVFINSGALSGAVELNSTNRYTGITFTDNLGSGVLQYDGTTDRFNITKKLNITGTITSGSIISSSVPQFVMPNDYWENASFYSINNFGSLHSRGDYEVSLSSNGYRNNLGTWTSYGVNGFTGAGQININPQGYITFNTEGVKANGSSATITERMRIISNGNIGVGTLSPTELLDVNGSVKGNTFKNGKGTWRTSGEISILENTGNGPHFIYGGSFGNNQVLALGSANTTGVGVFKSSATNGALDVNGNGIFSGNVTATSFIGSGASLTGLNATNISSGTLADNRLSGNIALKNAANVFNADQTINGDLLIENTASSGYFKLNGVSSIFQLLRPTGLLGLQIDTNTLIFNNTTDNSISINTSSLTTDRNLTVQDASGTIALTSDINKSAIDALGIDAGTLTGTLNDARLSSNVPLVGNDNTFFGINTFEDEIDADQISANNIITATIRGALLEIPIKTTDITSSYTLSQADAGKVLEVDLASGSINITVDSNSLSNIGDVVYFNQINNGYAFFDLGTGVTIQYDDQPLVNANTFIKNRATGGKFTECKLQKVGSSTYRLTGDLRIELIE